MTLKKIAAPLVLSSALLFSGASVAEAKAGKGKGKGKGDGKTFVAMKACMTEQGVTRADRGTAEFRAARKACAEQLGLKGRTGEGARKRGPRA